MLPHHVVCYSECWVPWVDDGHARSCTIGAMTMSAMLPPHGWRYTGLTHSRRQTLEEPAPLGYLVGALLALSDLGGIDVRERCDEAKLEKVAANRVGFQLRPRTSNAREALDRLLNGDYGLRARYCVSPEEGSRATAFVCREIAVAIRERSIGLASGVSNDDVKALTKAMEPSLNEPSAKAWFDPPTDKRAVTLDDGQVFSAVWDRSRRLPEAVQSALPGLSPQQITVLLAKGQGVPLPAFLDIKGAFVTAEGLAYVPASKRTRALQIHLMGWT